MALTKRRGQQPRQPPSESRVSATSIVGSDLCKRCKQINLDTIFQMKHLTKVGKPIRNLGPTKDWSAHSCPLCHLMLQLVPRHDKISNRVVLRSLSSNKISNRGWQAVDITMLAVGRGSSFLLKQPKDLPVIRLIQPKINPAVIKDWLRYCEDNHSSACKEGDIPASSKPTRSPFSAITSFKLIDCETRQIVQGYTVQYVALSYVWGAGEEDPAFADMLPAQLPETIEDAITVSRSLGKSHLWIDRYCIGQSNPTEVREQVGQMDLIYSCAYLTIIAAAGETPHYGLPGVGRRSRKPHPHNMVHGHVLISTLPNLRKEITQSKWFQRGWTYQEGILSPRRLVFIDRQIYFECSGMYCCEALNLPLASLHIQNGQRFKAKFCYGDNICMFPKRTGTSEWEIIQRIQDYSRKQLTNPSDILNGIFGILQAFARSRKRVLHCAGVPMILATSKRRRLGELDSVLQEWSPLAGFCGGLC